MNGKTAIDLRDIRWGKILRGFVGALALPGKLVPLLCVLLLYVLSARYVLLIEPETDDRLRSIYVTADYLAVPVAIGCTYVFGTVFPALLLATLPLGILRVQATEVLTIGFGADLALTLLLVTSLTVYLKETDFLSRRYSMPKVASALLVIAVIYAAFWVSVESGDRVLSIALGGGKFETLVIILALLHLSEDRDRMARSFRALAGAIVILLFIDSIGIVSLILDGRTGPLRIDVGSFKFSFANWLAFAVTMALAYSMALLIRSEISGVEPAMTSAGLFGLLSGLALFYLFRYEFEFRGELGINFALRVDSLFVYLTAGLIGYRLGRQGLYGTCALLIAIVLVAYGVAALVPSENWSRIIYVEGQVFGSYAEFSSKLFVVRAAPIPFIATAAAMAYLGNALKHRVQTLRDANSDRPAS